MQHNIKKDAKL